ncbi:MAG: sulfatase-like hydrolase/transferase [Candidatus Lokiarchaeota archaeon]|nr:sulfatase-like hydrolase/transferase [Candidatus Lokiarchaeota archaeon]MBD3200249.1 sulfatase-like hydrolase/transferase [Candidatus Lokiarchaeota archaeon]
MKVIMVMFDTLNRRFLPPYDCSWTHAPNFKRLQSKSVVFDNCYAGSIPCMPARREIHTGRYNFLHRSWGPIEPFDDSMPQILRENGVYSHLVSDHYHYWEDGGATYHNRYTSWEISRGQEGDFWRGEVKDPSIPEHVKIMRESHTIERMSDSWRQDWVNRKYMTKETQMPQAKTFQKGLEFLKTNHQEDNWFLHIETFDPHEPFYVPENYRKLYSDKYDGPHFDWPDYSVDDTTHEQKEHVRFQYAALLSMCDHYLGKILDFMDEKDMWKDTMLIVNTDHGFFLGEKGFWGKLLMPEYNELVHIPLFIWDPRSGKKNERRAALVQTIDLAPTILDFFNIKIPNDMRGIPLNETIESDMKIRDAALYGQHGSFVNITDGRYVYMRGPLRKRNRPLFNYTLMPTHMRNLFSPSELRGMELSEAFSFTKDCKVLKIKAYNPTGTSNGGKHFLFDLKADPTQEDPINNREVEAKMKDLMIKLMIENDTPEEQFQRLGLKKE